MDDLRMLHPPRTGGTSLRESWRLVRPEYQNHKPPTPARFSYGFCRNPWDRLVSLYHLRYSDLSRSFREWVLEDGAHFHDGGIPIIAPCVFWLKDANFVGRFERRDEDLKVLCEILDRPFPDKHEGKTQRGPYRDYYDAETKAWVAERYSEDIRAYGYEF